MREITERDLELLATGAWILGAGGGGDPYHSLLAMKRLYSSGTTTRLMDPDDLADDARIAVVSTMGAPLVGEERLTDPEVAARAVQMMEEYIGHGFDAVMTLEIGGSNSIQPIMDAAFTGLPVLDADTMGRAYPEAQMSSFAIGDLRPYPLTLADPRGVETVVSKVPTWKWMERVSRKICTEVGSTAATCKAPRTGHEVKEWGILRTVSQAIDIGRAVHEARQSKQNPVQAVVDCEDGRILFEGKIVEVNRRTTEGFLRGSVELEGLEADKGHRMKLDFQNEFSIGWINEEPRVMVPDIITVLDSTTGEAIGTEAIRYGQRVQILVLRAPEIQTTPKGLEHVGPRAFGYDLDFESVFAEAEGT